MTLNVLNQACNIQAISYLPIFAYEPFSITLVATDPDALDTLTYTYSFEKFGISIFQPYWFINDGANCGFYPENSDAGQYTIQISATDDNTAEAVNGVLSC